MEKSKLVALPDTHVDRKRIAEEVDTLKIVTMKKSLSLQPPKRTVKCPNCERRHLLSHKTSGCTSEFHQESERTCSHYLYSDYGSRRRPLFISRHRSRINTPSVGCMLTIYLRKKVCIRL
jgi:hypothetical protein